MVPTIDIFSKVPTDPMARRKSSVGVGVLLHFKSITDFQPVYKEKAFDWHDAIKFSCSYEIFSAVSQSTVSKNSFFNLQN